MHYDVRAVGEAVVHRVDPEVANASAQHESRAEAAQHNHDALIRTNPNDRQKTANLLFVGAIPTGASRSRAFRQRESALADPSVVATPVASPWADVAAHADGFCRRLCTHANSVEASVHRDSLDLFPNLLDFGCVPGMV